MINNNYFRIPFFSDLTYNGLMLDIRVCGGILLHGKSDQIR